MNAKAHGSTWIASLAASIVVLAAGGAAEPPTANRVLGWLDRKIAEQRSDAPPVPILFSYRDDHNRGVRWSPDDVIALLTRRPDALLALGNFGPGYPIGSPLFRALGGRVNRWQRAIGEWNAEHDPDIDPGRICIDWRPDLVFKHVDGSDGEAHCGTLLGENQCAPELTTTTRDGAPRRSAGSSRWASRKCPRWFVANWRS